jgi:hypothetical protein
MAIVPILSKEFAIIYGGEVIGYATDFSLEINKETVDITKLGDSWKNKLVDTREFSVSFNGMVTRGNTINSHLWKAATSYSAGAFVIMAGKAYEAQSTTQGHNPTTDGGVHWIEVGVWSSGTTYPSGEIVEYTTVANETRKYKSLQAANLNHNPTSSPTWWERIDTGYQSLLNELFHNNTAVKVTIKPTGSATTYYYGDGFLTSLSAAITVGDKVTFSGTFESNGSLATGTTP